MKKIKVISPAKINLLLSILNKRKDNYHNIETIFEKVSLCDTITMREISSGGILVTTNSKNLPLDSRNLCYRAADAIKKFYKIRTGVHIVLEKNIPISAGLGGGSSDAASVLKGLNILWKLRLGKNDLINISKALGSDVALFILGSSFVLGRGCGDDVCGLKHLNKVKLWHVLIYPPLEISTALAYSLYESYENERIKGRKRRYKQPKLKLTMSDFDVNIMAHALYNRDVFLLDCYSYNDFSGSLFYRFKKLNYIKQKVERLSGCFAHLSGSGSVLFTIHAERKEAYNLVKQLQSKLNGCRLFMVSTYKNEEV